MVIVHVVEPFATGINTFIQELVFGIPNHEHYIVHGERDDTRAIEEIKKEYLGKAQFIKWKNAQREISIIKDFKAYVELNSILKKIDFDVLHLHSSKAGIIGRFIGFTKGYNQIVYTPNAASFLRTDITETQRNLFRRVEKTASRFNTNIISSSRSEYRAYKELGINTRIIQNGTTIPQEIRVNNNGHKKFNIVICGKITIQKDPVFFNRIAKFFGNDPSISFTWIGDGELKHTLTSKNINITGWCSKSDVFEHLRKADLYLSTSSWEGLPIASIEALAFGLPLLMNKCFGNSDMITPGVNGFLFDSREIAIEYIEYLKNDIAQYKLLSEKSVKMYERHFNKYRCAIDYEQLYSGNGQKPHTAILKEQNIIDG
ncbi:MAG: glycosyltransferase [Flavobacteriales bacterium]|nr:glycosyltransferase [Flavobacteriales bacterium]